MAAAVLRRSVWRLRSLLADGPSRNAIWVRHEHGRGVDGPHRGDAMRPRPRSGRCGASRGCPGGDFAGERVRPLPSRLRPAHGGLPPAPTTAGPGRSAMSSERRILPALRYRSCQGCDRDASSFSLPDSAEAMSEPCEPGLASASRNGALRPSWRQPWPPEVPSSRCTLIGVIAAENSI